MRPRAERRALVRRNGRRADYAALRARIDASHVAGDRDGEREACLQLARRLAAKGSDLGEATALAARALSLSWDAEMQRELAAWLESLGDHALAASSLRRVADLVTEPRKAVSLRIKIGVLRARAGDASGAAESFKEAAAIEAQDSLAMELYATLAAWAPSEVKPKDAARAYADAAELRARAGQHDAELEDLLRGFETDSTCEIVAKKLAEILEQKGRDGAADEVLRVHGTARKDGAVVHEERLKRALEKNQISRALGAALDGAFDGLLNGEDPDAFDDVLQRHSLFEPIAARLDARACVVSGVARGRVLSSLERLLSGPLASPSRAARAWAASVIADPSTETIARASDHAPNASDVVFDALTDVLLSDAPAEARLGASRALAACAETYGEPALAQFAFQRGADLSRGDAELLAGARRLAPAAARVREEADIMRRSLDVTEGDARASLLRSYVAAVRALPDEMAHLFDALTELVAVAPHDANARADLFRYALRRADFRRAEAALSGEERPRERVDFGCALAFALGRDGELVHACRVVSAIHAVSERLACATWMLGAVTGDEDARTNGLGAFAEHCPNPARGTLLAVASNFSMRLGHTEAAQGFAEAACKADPHDVRSVVALADSISTENLRTYASVLERAMTLSIPRAKSCMRLARALAELGDADAAAGWARRLLALRPGDLGAVAELANLMLEGREHGKIADMLAWILSQPLPSRSLSELAARVLGRLADLDIERAVVFARRALEVLGVRNLPLRDALLLTSERANNAALTATVLERWLGSSAVEDERAEIYYRLAKAYRAIGDRDAEAHSIVRALDEGANREDIEALVRDLAVSRLSPEGELGWLAARVLVADDSTRVEASRDYAAALFDLAGDRRGAIRVLVDGGDDAEDTVKDAVELMSLDVALPLLAEFARETTKVETRASITHEAARAAHRAGQHSLAFTLSCSALEADPEHAAPLEVAEASARAAAMWNPLTELYDVVALRSLGRFGRRAAHYRGARFFESAGENRLALKHASLAFTAVPSDKTLDVLARTSEAVNERDSAARVVADVAEGSRAPQLRAQWLLRAAALAPEDEDGLRQRVDLLLRAMVASTERAIFALLVDTAKKLLALAPDDREVLTIRLERAATALGARAEGPEGARRALAFAELAAEVLGDAELAWRSILRAIKLDGDIDEYDRLLPFADMLAKDREVAPAIRAALAEAERPYSNVGLAALKLLSRIGKLGGESEMHARALVMAVERESDDDGLLMEAHEAAVMSSNPATLERLMKKVGAARLEEARKGSSPHLAAVKIVDNDEISFADAGISEAHETPKKEAPLPPRIVEPMEPGPPTPMSPSRFEAVFSPPVSAPVVQSIPVDSLDRGWTAPPSPLSKEQTPPSQEAISEAAATIPGIGGADTSVHEHVDPQTHEQPHELEPAPRTINTEPPASTFLSEELEEQLANEERYEELSIMLAQREQRLVARGDEDRARALRFRLAVVLEQRLGNIQEAKKTLERILESDPQNEGALRYLADLCERHEYLGLAESAVAALERLREVVSSDPSQRVEINLRLARSHLACGRNAKARDIVHEVLSASPSLEEAIALRVTIARAIGDPIELGESLERRARIEQDDMARASLLVEAARAGLGAGDLDAALSRTRQALGVTPDDATLVLLAAEITYRARGVGAPDEARAMAEALDRLGNLRREDAELVAFLRAEALDATTGRGAGLDLLRAHPAQNAPLVALGIAERFVRVGRFEEALPRFSLALSGELRAFRPRAKVALSAADAAMHAKDLNAASLYLDQAMHEPALAHLVTEKRAEVSRMREAALMIEAAPSEPAMVPPPPGIESADNADNHSEPQIQAGNRSSGNMESAPTVLDSADLLQLAQDDDEDEANETPISLVSMRANARAAASAVAVAQVVVVDSPAQTTDAELSAKAAEGSIAAIDELAERWSKDPERTTDVVRLRHRAVEVCAFDIKRLEALHKAALADNNGNHARAVDHVLRMFDPGAGPLPPPPLGAQTEHPGFMKMLTTPSRDPATMALAALWEGASGLFAKKAAAFNLTGTERLIAGPQTPVGRIYEFAIRLLDVSRVAVFVKKTQQGGLAHHVALMQPPSAVIEVDPHAGLPEIACELGEAIASAIPENALALGLSNEDLTTTWNAMLGAFGSPDNSKRFDRLTMPLAEAFWQTLPSRAQRRVAELVAQAEDSPATHPRNCAMQSARRAGLFLCGDFAIAARRLLTAKGANLRALTHPSAFADACASDPDLIDLVRLAVLPDYADARWSLPPPGSQRYSTGVHALRGAGSV